MNVFVNTFPLSRRRENELVIDFLFFTVTVLFLPRDTFPEAENIIELCASPLNSAFRTYQSYSLDTGRSAKIAAMASAKIGATDTGMILSICLSTGCSIVSRMNSFLITEFCRRSIEIGRAHV